MGQTVHIVIVLHDRKACETLADHLTDADIAVSETGDMKDVPALMADKMAVPANLSSQAISKQYCDTITSIAANSLTGAHCILVSQDKNGSVQNSQHKARKYMYTGMTLEEMERNHIIQTLQANGWQIQHAAKALGIDRSTLYRKMKKYNISNH